MGGVGRVLEGHRTTELYNGLGWMPPGQSWSQKMAWVWIGRVLEGHRATAKLGLKRSFQATVMEGRGSHQPSLTAQSPPARPPTLTHCSKALVFRVGSSGRKFLYSSTSFSRESSWLCSLLRSDGSVSRMWLVSCWGGRGVGGRKRNKRN